MHCYRSALLANVGTQSVLCQMQGTLLLGPYFPGSSSGANTDACTVEITPYMHLTWFKSDHTSCRKVELGPVSQILIITDQIN